jgi:inosine-uridine nucleoside N-ribohydrolase
MKDFGMTPEASSPDRGMELSYNEILKVLKIMDGEYVGRIFRGSEAYLPGEYDFVDSPAARDLVTRAMESDEPLYVLAIAAPTNIASAILMEPEIIKKIVVVWLGGQPYDNDYAWEFNLMQDMYASRLLFDSGVPLVHIPCNNVASKLVTTVAELRYYLGDVSIAGYLTNIVADSFNKLTNVPALLEMVRALNPGTFGEYQEELWPQFKTEQMARSRSIWDVSAIAYLVNPFWCPTNFTPAPILTSKSRWERDASRHLVRVCSSVQRDAVFGDMFAKLKKA